MSFKEQQLKELKEFLDRKVFGGTTITYAGAMLFYDLLIKDIKEDKEMEYGKLVNSLAETDMPEKIVTLSDTENPMKSADYKKRFVAEYYQTKIQYEKLKAFNNKIEAARITNLRYLPDEEKRASTVEMPKHDCPDDLLLSQQHTMGEYLHLLEVRAVIEGIDLEAYK